MKNLLPIGSVVLLENAEKRLMICGIMQLSSDDNKVYDYIGCLYPEGMIDDESFYLFNQQDIKQVDYLGYSDSEYQLFRAAFYEDLEKQGLG